MVTKTKLHTELYKELREVIDTTYNVADADDHVDHQDADNHPKYPSLTFRSDSVPIIAGFNEDWFVEDVIYNDNGILDHIVYKWMYNLHFDIVASAAEDNEQRKHHLYEAVENHFQKYSTPFYDLSDIHTDVTAITVGGSDDVDSATAIRSDSLTVELKYEKYMVVDQFDTVNNVKINLVVNDEIAAYEF